MDGGLVGQLGVERGDKHRPLAGHDGLASVAGPLLGGLFTDHLSWRWVFYVNLPIGVLALLIVTYAFDLPVRRGRPQVDYPGAALLAAGVSSVP